MEFDLPGGYRVRILDGDIYLRERAGTRRVDYLIHDRTIDISRAGGDRQLEIVGRAVQAAYAAVMVPVIGHVNGDDLP